MTTIRNWHNETMEVARSSGGVLATVNPWQNVISTGVRPWPAPELIQKIYQSRQVRAFSGDERRLAMAALGFYSDLQSIHSEDAISQMALLGWRRPGREPGQGPGDAASRVLRGVRPAPLPTVKHFVVLGVSWPRREHLCVDRLVGESW
jgi:hypothetical protein